MQLTNTVSIFVFIHISNIFCQNLIFKNVDIYETMTNNLKLNIINFINSWSIFRILKEENGNYVEECRLQNGSPAQSPARRQSYFPPNMVSYKKIRNLFAKNLWNYFYWRKWTSSGLSFFLGRFSPHTFINEHR